MKGLAPSTQAELAERAAREGWSAHRTEEEVQRQKRVAEQEAQRRREDADRVKNDLERLQAEITALAAAKKPGLETEIVVFQDYYGQGDVKITALAAALQKAGFTNVRIASRHGDVEPRPSGGLCNCIAWKATLHSTYAFSSGGYTTKLQATPACIVPAHRQAKATADRKAEVAKYALQDQVQARVKADRLWLGDPRGGGDRGRPDPRGGGALGPPGLSPARMERRSRRQAQHRLGRPPRPQRRGPREGAGEGDRQRLPRQGRLPRRLDWPRRSSSGSRRLHEHHDLQPGAAGGRREARRQERRAAPR
jgi:hypothetical protein